jgi:hypothetical protein
VIESLDAPCKPSRLLRGVRNWLQPPIQSTGCHLGTAPHRKSCRAGNRFSASHRSRISLPVPTLLSASNRTDGRRHDLSRISPGRERHGVPGAPANAAPLGRVAPGQQWDDDVGPRSEATICAGKVVRHRGTGAVIGRAFSWTMTPGPAQSRGNGHSGNRSAPTRASASWIRAAYSDCRRRPVPACVL